MAVIGGVASVLNLSRGTIWPGFLLHAGALGAFGVLGWKSAYDRFPSSRQVRCIFVFRTRRNYFMTDTSGCSIRHVAVVGTSQATSLERVDRARVGEIALPPQALRSLLGPTSPCAMVVPKDAWLYLGAPMSASGFPSREFSELALRRAASLAEWCAGRRTSERPARVPRLDAEGIGPAGLAPATRPDLSSHGVD
jgi:hypothetical protein